MQIHAHVGIIIPAYNEEMNIAKAIADVEEACKSFPHEIIVVDDGSVDATYGVATKTGATVLRHDRNMGKGAALRTALGATKGRFDILVIQDADLTIPAKEIPTLVERISRGESDVVYASRMHGTIDAGAMPTYRRVGNTLFALAVDALTGLRLSDTLSGQKAFNAKILDNINIETNSWPDFELIFKAWAFRCRASEVPVRYLPRRGRSKMKIFKHGSWFVWQIMKWYSRALIQKAKSHYRRNDSLRTDRAKPSSFERND